MYLLPAIPAIQYGEGLRVHSFNSLLVPEPALTVDWKKDAWRLKAAMHLPDLHDTD